MKKILIFLVLCFAAKVNYAQTDTARVATGKIEAKAPTFFKSAKFFFNGQPETFKQISIRLANANVSAYDFNEFKKYRNLTVYMGASAIACMLLSLPLNHGSNQWQTTQAKIAYGIGCGFIIPEFIFARKRDKHFWKAVKLYNHE